MNTEIPQKIKLDITVETIKEQINTNDAFAVQCMMKVYEYQTSTEQINGDTHEDNNVGFSGADAGILSSFVKQVERWQVHRNNFNSPLSERQMKIARRKMCKYTRQLLTILTNADYNIEPYKKQTPGQPLSHEIMIMKVIKLQFPRKYPSGIKFYLELLSQENDTIRTMIEVSSIDNPDRDVPTIGDSVEVSGIIKNGWLNVSSKCHYAIITKPFSEAYKDKIEIIRTQLTDLKGSNTVTNKTYSKAWNAVNELESELSNRSLPKTSSNSQTKLPEPITEPITKPITKPKPTEPAKPAKQILSNLLKEFEDDNQ